MSESEGLTNHRLAYHLPRHEPLTHGLVQIFTGEGRGKTSAALGTVLRAVGHGLRVYISFFFKGENYSHGEFKSLSQLPGVTLASFGQKGWIKPGEAKPEHREQARKGLVAAREAMLSGRYDLVVLDEVLFAVASKLLAAEEVVRLVEEKPPQVELILTGRDADPRLVEKADLVSKIVMVKHPFTKGVEARKGIDY
ncbi:MAG: cob(I)yrinic acid a,c-diamide adenosyltransferase [Chloroflexota bacterium]